VLGEIDRTLPVNLTFAEKGGDEVFSVPLGRDLKLKDGLSSNSRNIEV